MGRQVTKEGRKKTRQCWTVGANGGNGYLNALYIITTFKIDDGREDFKTFTIDNNLDYDRYEGFPSNFN